jgi:hypothetical protein
MGFGSFTPAAWDSFQEEHEIATTSIENTFGQILRSDFNPKNISLRESCETKDKPNVTPIIIALDVTGSMGKIPAALIRGGLGNLMKNILERASIPNPHVMFMAVGDVNYDRFPLQVTQFEADIRIAEQLKDLYLEGGGGPNNSESYPLAWYFAATKTKLHSFTERQEKGILFTIGDEYAPDKISAAHLRRFMGDEQAQDMLTTDILAKAQEKYDVFHLGILEHRRTYTADVESSWRKLLGQRLVSVEDYRKIDEVIVSTIDTLLAERNRIKEIASVRQHLASRVAVLSGAAGQVGLRNSPPAQQDAVDVPPPTYNQAMGLAP